MDTVFLTTPALVAHDPRSDTARPSRDHDRPSLSTTNPPEKLATSGERTYCFSVASASDNSSAPRPRNAPDFLLSRVDGSLRTQGSDATFTTISDAQSALDNGKASYIVGALPFDPSHPAALTSPRSVWRYTGPLEPPAFYRGKGAHAHIVAENPSLDEHAEIIDAVTRTIARTSVDKVVIARNVDLFFDDPIDPRLLATRLIDHAPNLDGFLADLSPAGDEYTGHWLVGSSPEMLIRRQGPVVSAYPLAGSLPRSNDPQEDEQRGQQLLHSTKNLDEHHFVVDHYRRVLSQLCHTVDIPSSPELMQTAEMWHLATPIRATINDDGPSALQLAEALYPTPALAGVPTEAAMEIIRTAEGDRRFYGGAVGWCHANGDGEFMVSIRCAELEKDLQHARAWAGGGIVEQSNPTEEVEETCGKMKTMLLAMGASEIRHN
ncbi:putative isochorismate synthase [Corynebacterium kroppenstedtii DSM 44385]|uniref:isochorismate synthase n=1 Tax=Corynebacterium kroppenstedtii (strain DSM 44385 / JCM 11950 / CIP 105744 / CCUG 35717) TaxID=645127 RepID=C4LJG7_CORK4|nr:putative isochorismate synthase [Corynebacterium kroppenstedtii DSM 44385]